MQEFIIQLENIKILVLFFVITVIAHLAINFVKKRLYNKAKNTTTKIDDVLIKTFTTPLKLFLWYLLLNFAIKFINITNYLFIEVIEFINILPIVIIVWSLFKLISNIESAILDGKSNENKDHITLFSRILKMIVAIAIILAAAQYFGFSVSSIITFGGVGGIVIGFAAKDMLANIFGGLMIQMDKPFSTGDWIRTTDSSIEGMVEKIGWRMTRIRTFSKNPIYIPNAIFSTLPIETPSRMTNRRIKEVIGVRYDDIKKLPKIIKEIEEFLSKHDKIDKKEPLRVYFDLFNASSVDFVVYAFSTITNATEFKKMKGKVLLDIADIIAKYDAEIAFPTQTIHIQK